MDIRRGLSALALLALCTSAAADPCGMVPPISVSDPQAITRVGPQKTYVFYKDGVETFVIRPGFSGKVEQFGMLIPFPTPPALRKVPDALFAHIGKVIDPPEVVVDLRPSRDDVMDGAPMGGAMAPQAQGKGMRLRDSVRVLRKEAVGMYEVAVLDAGSAAALKRWMDDHGYRYPTGMDRVCEDYVEARWCFVAVKTKVAGKAGADPRPGMKRAAPGLPRGASFDGHVQGMGFRFRCKELVVPMRLSAFNAGRLRNVVYLLTDGPSKIARLPASLVRRQVDGATLVRHLTGPLKLRILGGTIKDIPTAQWASIRKQRDPAPHNGLARELFAGDLLAARTKALSHPYEEAEKALLRIGEALRLRNGMDALHHTALSGDRDLVLADALAGLAQMTLTVIDGDFPREALAADNLRFERYQMPLARNAPAHYDATRLGPAPRNQRLHPGPRRGALSLPAPWLAGGLAALALAALALGLRRRSASAVAALALALTLVAPAGADPCGMVPPIAVSDPQAIVRVGPQRTYVFYKDGLETFVIRPGFSGKVEEFGMLIPFPTPPSVRKVEDRIFDHIAAAVDPPEVVVDLRPVLYDSAIEGDAVRSASGTTEDLGVTDKVTVLRKEAVGMYEVAVLDAGSAAALKRWMDDHGYRYPKGMDDVCESYVDQRWCFVAIKTRVAGKDSTDPRPGQREARPGMPAGASFDGSVQAMGFRFKTPQLVLPMRLSAFNAGKLRNVVYVLSDRPLRLREIDGQQVRRQIDGATLVRNLTAPLPLRVIGGTIHQVSKTLREGKGRRIPGRVNGLARELFLGDLLAARSGQLVLGFEIAEKTLLEIGERLRLRGPELDAMHRKALAPTREEALTAADIAGLRGMTLSVIDGDFPRETLAGDNLHAAEYALSSELNHARLYDAVAMGPATRPRQGIRYYQPPGAEPTPVPDISWARALALVGGIAVVLVIGLWLVGGAVSGARR